MDKRLNLQSKARVLQSILERYALIDEDARTVLAFMAQLFKQIQAGEIEPPHENEFRWYFASTEAPLYRRYEDLSHAASDYSCALEDWESQEWYKQLKGESS